MFVTDTAHRPHARRPAPESPAVDLCRGAH